MPAAAPIAATERRLTVAAAPITLPAAAPVSIRAVLAAAAAASAAAAAPSPSLLSVPSTTALLSLTLLMPRLRT
eukprot:6647158-Prymnesium_polylepis.1